MKAKVDGKIRKHIPDHFLVTNHGPEHGHVINESQLELARLLFADSVNRIFAQPFLLNAQVKTSVCRHVPDFLLLSDR